jgi:hypothetical protein
MRLDERILERFGAQAGRDVAGTRRQRPGLEPNNCAWATPRQQHEQADQPHGGAGVSLAELAERSGIGYATLQSRLDRGRSVERMPTTPVRARSAFR